MTNIQLRIVTEKLLNAEEQLVQIFRMKNAIPLAALKAYRTTEVVKILRTAFPRFVPSDNVLKTSLGNK